MYEEIVALLDEQLERLRRARALLAGSVEERLPLKAKEQEKPQPDPQEAPSIQRLPARKAPVRRGPQMQKKPTGREGALQGAAPVGVVVIPAAEVQKSEPARQDAAGNQEAVAVKEGTLDALIEQLGRAGKNEPRPSAATSFPFSRESN